VRARLISIALVMLAGCNTHRLAVRLFAPVLLRGADAFEAEPDLDIARTAAPGQIKAADGLLETDPRNRYLLQILAKGCLELAYGFVEDDLESLPADATAESRRLLVWRATDLYDRALVYALRLLDVRQKGFRDAFTGDRAALDAALARMGRDGVPGLVYGGMGLASAVNINRADPSRALDLPKAIAMLKRARELDPRFEHGAGVMTLGIIYASQPKDRGGDPATAKSFFDEAIAVSGGKFLMPRVMLARAYAVAIHDRALFESSLRAVLSTPVDIMPEARLANELARRRAARYLDHAGDWF
jgi:hypothetical protein